MTFQRARSDEQREQRRAAVLDAATEMLGQMPVADVTLNALSRRVGLAKSNVLRYFESREAVLLELLDRALREWADDLVRAWPLRCRAGVVRRCAATGWRRCSPPRWRPVRCCATCSPRRPGCWSGTSPPRSRPATSAPPSPCSTTSPPWSPTSLPELSAAAAQRFCAALLLVTGASWSYSQPSAALVAAYEAEPELAVLRLEHEDVLRELVAVLLSGLLARGA